MDWTPAAPISTYSTSIPLRTLPLSPFFATHADSPFRKSFLCHSYENCRVCTNNSHFETERRELPSRDEKPVAVTPSESAFTNCDALNSFRMCSYENGRVSLVSITENLKLLLELPIVCLGRESPGLRPPPHTCRRRRSKTRTDCHGEPCPRRTRRWGLGQLFPIPFLGRR